MPTSPAVSVLRWYGLWQQAFVQGVPAKFARVLSPWIHHQRWFLGKGSQHPHLELVHSWLVPVQKRWVWWLIVQAEQALETARWYQVPVVLLDQPGSEKLIARVQGHQEGWLADAWSWPALAELMLELLEKKRLPDGWPVDLRLWWDAPIHGEEPAALVDTDQSNTILRFGDRYFFKVFRALTPGAQPDEEVGRFLQRHGYRHAPAPLAGIHWRHGVKTTLALCADFIPNKGSAWTWLVERLHEADEGVPVEVAQAMELLGQRTAGLHIALASPSDDAAFTPEPITRGWMAGLQARVLEKAENTEQLLRRSWKKLADARELAVGLLGRKDELRARIMGWQAEGIDGVRTRIHGDYHLGQVLRTLEDDWEILDFEGEPLRPLEQRRMKDSPLRDVAGMMRSFAYARAVAHPRPLKMWLETGGDDDFGAAWQGAIGQFLQRYFATVQGQGILPTDLDAVQRLLDLYLLEKVLYEVDYELKSRPHWVWIPLLGWKGLMGIVGEGRPR